MNLTTTILKLNFILWRRSFFAHLPQVLNAAILLLFGVIGAVSWGIISYFSLAEEGDPSGFITALSIGMVLYLLYGFMFPGGESSLDIRSFAPLPLKARAILPGYVLCAFFQSRGFVALINTIIMVVCGVAALYSRGELLLSLMWALACIVQLIMTILVGEAVASLFDSKGSRFQEKLGVITGFLFLIILMGIYILPSLMVNSSDSSEPSVLSGRRIVDIMQWTPFGSIPSTIFAPTSMGMGSLFGCVAMVLLSILYAGIALALWYGFILRALKQPFLGSHHSARSSTNSSLLFSWTPPTPAGAILSRDMRYWRRDSRFISMWMILPFLALFYVLLGIVSGSDFYVWFSFPLLVLLLLTIAGNHYGYDGPGNWVHCASGVSTRTMVRTRALSVGMIWSLWFIVLLVLVGVLKGFSALWFINLVLGISSALTILGISSYFSVKFPYPTPAPGANPFRAKNNAGAIGILTLLIGMGVILMVVLPTVLVIAFTFKEVATSSIADIPIPVWGVLALSICCGVLVLYCGNLIAARLLSREWPRIMQKVQHYT